LLKSGKVKGLRFTLEAICRVLDRQPGDPEYVPDEGAGGLKGELIPPTPKRGDVP
jgi:hypothetical protein